MPIIQQSLEVPYTVSEMYQLVDNIDSYSEFLPWCTESQVLERNEDEVNATLTLSGGGFSKSFTTCNRLQKNKMIEIRLVHGPFKQLEGFWAFEKTKTNGCKVSLSLEFEFSSLLLSMAFGPVFHQVATALVDAFSDRAKQVYGKKDD